MNLKYCKNFVLKELQLNKYFWKIYDNDRRYQNDRYTDIFQSLDFKEIVISDFQLTEFKEKIIHQDIIKFPL